MVKWYDDLRLEYANQNPYEEYFTFDERFLLSILSLQALGNKDLAKAELIELVKNAPAIIDSVSKLHALGEDDATLSKRILEYVNPAHDALKTEINLMDTDRETKEFMLFLHEAIKYRYDESRKEDLYGAYNRGRLGRNTMEDMKNRFVTRYPESPYVSVMDLYLNDAENEKWVRKDDGEERGKDFLGFDFGISFGIPFFGGKVAEIVDPVFDFHVEGSIQVYRVLVFFGFGGILANGQELWTGTSYEQHGKESYLAAGLDLALGYALIEEPSYTLDAFVGISMVDYDGMVDVPDFLVRNIRFRAGAQFDYRIPVGEASKLFFRARYTWANEGEMYKYDYDGAASGEIPTGYSGYSHNIAFMMGVHFGVSEYDMSRAKQGSLSVSGGGYRR